MLPPDEAPIIERVRLLEARLGRLRSLLLFLALVVVAMVTLGAARRAPVPGGRAAASFDVVRVRGIVVEDSAGRPRILIGAPVPAVAGRRRGDPASGLVWLAENGVDRLQLGAVGDPQMGGRLSARMSPGTGLVVNDASGDERGGFGAFENGQVGWGLDFPGREAIVAAVIPERKMAGLVLSTDADAGQRFSLFADPGGATMQLCDSTGVARASLAVQGGGTPRLESLDPKGSVVIDALAAPGRR